MSIFQAIGGLVSSGLNIWNSQNQIKQQKNMAKNQVQWRVQDAQKAGVHPLAALGFQGQSYSPVGLGDTSGMEKAGQSIDNSIRASQDQTGRAAQELSLEHARLQNQYLSEQILSIRANRTGQPPAQPGPTSRMLIDGQGETSVTPPPGATPPGIIVNDGTYSDEALKRIAPNPFDRSAESAAVTDRGYSRSAGGHAVLMSRDAQQRLEEDHWGAINWGIRNRLYPLAFEDYYRPPPGVPVQPGYGWFFDPFTGEYRQLPISAAIPHEDSRRSTSSRAWEELMRRLSR